MIAFGLTGSLTSCIGQGLINFYNTPSTLISVFPPGSSIAGPVGSAEFALLTSPVGANNFSFAGVYGTNTTTPGMFTGDANVAVPGWAPGTARDFAVFGWNPNYVLYDPSWLKSDLSLGTDLPHPFGVSEVGTGVAGGFTSSGAVPTLDIFGGATGIQHGFVLFNLAPVPEPSTIALGGLGAVLLMLRFRQKRYLLGK